MITPDLLDRGNADLLLLRKATEAKRCIRRLERNIPTIFVWIFDQFSEAASFPQEIALMAISGVTCLIDFFATLTDFFAGHMHDHDFHCFWCQDTFF